MRPLACPCLPSLQLKKSKKAGKAAEAPRFDYSKSAAVFAKLQEQRDSGGGGGAAAAGGEGGGRPAAQLKL